MRPLMRVALVTALATAGFVPAVAETPEETFDKGCHAYDSGKWDEAADAFHALTRLGFEDARLEYNLANSEYKRGRLGEAILHYEKARRLDPADVDIASNLAIARQRIRDVVEDPDAAGPLAAWRHVQDRIGVEAQALAALAGLWLVAGIVTWCASRPGGFTPAWGWALVAAIVVTTCVSLSAHATWTRLDGTPRAVILKPSVEALAGPGLNNTALFTLHEGTAVEVRSERPGWLQVALPGGLTGWVGSDVAGRI